MAASNRKKSPESKPLPLSHRQLHGRAAHHHARRHRLSLRVEPLNGWLAWDDVDRRLRSGQLREDDLSVRASVKYRGYWAHFDHADSPGIYHRGKLVRQLSYEDNPRTAQMWIEGHLGGCTATLKDSVVLFLPGTKTFDKVIGRMLDLSGRMN